MTIWKHSSPRETLQFCFFSTCQYNFNKKKEKRFSLKIQRVVMHELLSLNGFRRQKKKKILILMFEPFKIKKIKIQVLQQNK